MLEDYIKEEREESIRIKEYLKDKTEIISGVGVSGASDNLMEWMSEMKNNKMNLEGLI